MVSVLGKKEKKKEKKRTKRQLLAVFYFFFFKSEVTTCSFSVTSPLPFRLAALLVSSSGERTARLLGWFGTSPGIQFV
jgi:hypothetical protein